MVCGCDTERKHAQEGPGPFPRTTLSELEMVIAAKAGKRFQRVPTGEKLARYDRHRYAYRFGRPGTVTPIRGVNPPLLSVDDRESDPPPFANSGPKSCRQVSTASGSCS